MRDTLVLLLLVCPAFAAPVPKSVKPALISGTSWSGITTWDNGIVQSFRITFRDDGSMVYHNDDSVPCSWNQNGDTVTFTINNFSNYEVRLADGKLTGKGRNNNGLSASLVLNPVDSGAKP